MAQPFETRLATGLRSHAQNCETLRSLIVETEAERDRQLELQAASEKDAIDVLLNASERDEAAAAADRSRRLARGYDDAIANLQAKLEAKLTSERRESEQKERQAALDERDQIAAEFAAAVPKAVDMLTALFRRVEANAARLRALRIYERDAEAEARDLPGNYMLPSGPVDRFSGMKIPGWGATGRAWPLDPESAERARIAEQERQSLLLHKRANSPKARAERKAAEEAKWKRYAVTHKKIGFLDIDCRTGTASILDTDRTILEMNDQQVAAARAKGAQVVEAGAGERSTLAGNVSLQTCL